MGFLLYHVISLMFTFGPNVCYSHAGLHHACWWSCYRFTQEK